MWRRDSLNNDNTWVTVVLIKSTGEAAETCPIGRIKSILRDFGRVQYFAVDWASVKIGEWNLCGMF